MKLRLISIALSLAALFSLTFTASAAVHVRGHTDKNGRYTPPHERSAPNHSKSDNWSTKGNVNPYTGKAGTASVIGSGSLRGAAVGSESQQPAPTTAPRAISAPSAKPAEPKSEIDKRVIEFQKKRAEDGSAQAQYDLGTRYLKGDGVPKDESTGRSWLLKAAKQDHKDAKRAVETLNAKPAAELEPTTK